MTRISEDSIWMNPVKLTPLLTYPSPVDNRPFSEEFSKAEVRDMPRRGVWGKMLPDFRFEGRRALVDKNGSPVRNGSDKVMIDHLLSGAPFHVGPCHCAGGGRSKNLGPNIGTRI